MNFEFTYVWTRAIYDILFLSAFCWISLICIKKDFLSKFLNLEFNDEIKLLLVKSIKIVYAVMFISILISGLNINFADTKEYRNSQNYQSNISYQERKQELPKKVEVFNYKKEYKNLDESITKEQNDIHINIKESK